MSAAPVIDVDGLGVKPILAKPTRNYPGGLRPGFTYWVDPTSPAVRELLQLGRLIPVTADKVEASGPHDP